MNWKLWTYLIGSYGIFELIQNGEWESFMHDVTKGRHLGYNYDSGNYWEVSDSEPAEDDWALEHAKTWINAGEHTLANVFMPIKALIDVIDDFNTFMEELQQGVAEYQGLFDEWLTIDPDTGLRVLPNLEVVLPNGLVLTIFDSGEVMDFRVPADFGHYKGFVYPVVWKRHWNMMYIGYRLKSEPTFSFIVPGTDEWMYINPLNGLKTQGKLCTPVQGIDEKALEYITASFLIFGFICDIIRSLGLVKSLSAWWQRHVFKKKIKDIHSTIDDVQEIVTEQKQTIDDMNVVITDVVTNYYEPFYDLGLSKIEQLFLKLKNLGYHPY